MIKGLRSIEDVARAAEIGADAVAISNHGGRPLDWAVAPLDLLPAARQAVGDRITIVVDGGFRRGADAVLVRRAVLYGRAAAGKNGAKRAFAISGWKIGGTGCGRRLMPISGPIELGGIERRHLNHHQVHIDPAMQFRTQAVGEPADPRIWRRNTPMQRYSPAAEAEPTWTIVPRLRGRIRFKAAIVP